MEPERPIEKWLRAYAKKRREAGNDAFTLHPWVRRRLQDAVAQQFAGTKEASFSLWQLFRQRWVRLTGFALVLFLSVALLLPALRHPQKQPQAATAMNQHQPIGAATPMEVAANNERQPVVLTADAPVPTASAKALEPPTQRLAAGELAMAASPAIQGQRRLLQSPAAADVTKAKVRLGASASPQRFVQTALKTGVAPPVLASFELRQNGSAIAIVDRDGSIYNGFIAPETGNAGKAFADSAGPFLSFQVQGENQTLQQNLVFAGIILSETTGVETNQATQPAPFAHSRITGTVTLDATNQIKIEAVPVTP